MLGPVSAPTNLYQPVQDSRIQAEAPATDRLPASAAAEPYAASTATAIAGNLNMMLLSAPERMSQNLVVLTEVLASVLKMKQEPNEPLATFAARLIEAIATLAPAEQQKLKAMLSDAFAGLQLRTLLQALRNPQGPEAATLAIYLELYRQKDRDPSARAVISSYRQNDETAPSPSTLNPTARDPRATGQQPPPSVTVPTRQPNASPTAGQMAVTGSTAALVKSEPQATAEEMDMDYGAALTAQPAGSGEPTDGANLRALRQMRDRLAAAAEPQQAKPPAAAIVADLAGGVAAAMPDVEPAAAAEVDQPLLAAMPAKQDPDAAPVDREHARDADPRSVAGQVTSQHPATSLPAHLPEDVAELELIRTLLALYAAEDEPGVVDMALEALMPAETDEVEAKSASPSAAPLTEGAADDVDLSSPQRPIHWEEQLALATSSTVSEQGDPARMATSGDGLPLAFVNYVIESEDETETLRAMRKDQHEDEQPDEAADEEDASGEGTSDNPPEEDAEASASDIETAETEDRLDIGLSVPQLEAGEILPALPSPDEDPAQALYLRLSDFA